MKGNFSMHPLQYCGIPLGGIGAGTVELRPDGLFHEWQIMNNKPLAAGPEPQIPCDGAYFGCAAEGITARLNDPVDRLNDPYDQFFDPALSLDQLFVRLHHIFILPFCHPLFPF